MDNLAELKKCILTHTDPSEATEACYADFLNSYTVEHATVFIRLLSMLEPTNRVEEILKVMNFVIFPVKK